MELHEVVQKIVGAIEPVGETNADNNRFENLKVMEDLVDELISDLIIVSRQKDRYEHSIGKAGKHANQFLSHIRETIEDEGR